MRRLRMQASKLGGCFAPKSHRVLWLGPALLLMLLLATMAWSQESPSDQETGHSPTNSQDSAREDGLGRSTDASNPGRTSQRADVIASLTIFALAVFVGFEVITKVPPTLHTPLMSGSNAISGITLVGAVIAAAGMNFSSFIGFVAVTLATINAVGGFLVTHRMLAMFTKKKP